MAIWKAATRQMQRPDEILLGDIWRSLWKEETIRSIDIHDISVEVENGQACLSGHVARDINQQRIEEIARSVPGVIAVHNHIVADHDLTLQVLQALDNNKLTCPYPLPVSCHHGWVEIRGLVPSHAIQRAAEEAAARVPAVRGVVLPPDVEGEPGASLRNAVQPRVGAQVYGGDDTEGKVYQVVILPQNRLVTHAIVRAGRMIDGWQESHDYLIPVEAMQVVDESGILLNHSAPVIHKFPVFNPANSPYAPITWQPPYPYAAGSVRWPGQEQTKDEQLIKVNVEKAE